MATLVSIHKANESLTHHFKGAFISKLLPAIKVLNIVEKNVIVYLKFIYY